MSRNKKLEELNTLKQYLKNEKSLFNEDLFDEHVFEPAEFEYGGKGYQVVMADFDFHKQIHTKKMA